MKLLLVTTTAITLRSFLLPLATHFRSRGWQVDALSRGATSCEDCRNSFDKCFEAPWTRSPGDLRQALKAERVVRDVVEKEGYDIVHVHTPVAAFVTRHALRNRIRSTTVIYTAHGFHFHPNGSFMANAAFRLAEWLAGRWTDYLVVINGDDWRAARALRLVDPANMRLMPGIGIDLERYAPSRVTAEDLRKVRFTLGLDERNRLFLVVAEFNPGKRQAEVVRALTRASRPDLHVAFAGVGPQMDQVRALANSLGVAQQTHFLGYRTDVPALLRASVASILPSEREGLPRSIMEAMAMGVPVIGSDIRGIRDLLSDGAGILVPVGDVGQLSAAMVRLADNPYAAANIGQKGLKDVQRYSVGNVIAAHEELYAEVLESRVRASD